MKHTLRYHEFGESHDQHAVLLEQIITFMTEPEAKIAPALRGLRPESPLALSLGLPIFQILAAPRFAPLPILARTARAFHCVTGSKEIGFDYA
jgi:hypothetical protein